MSFQRIDIVSKISQLVVCELEFSLGSQRHFLDLLLVLGVLTHNVILLELSVGHDLFEDLFVVLLLVLDFLPHLLGLGSLALHHLMMLVHKVVHCLVMSLDCFSDGLLELSGFLLLLGLKVLELSSIFEHLLRVVISGSFHFDLELVLHVVDGVLKVILELPLVLLKGFVSLSVKKVGA